MQPLFTNHDKYHIHKSLGFICLIHYVIRIYFLIIYGTMFFNKDSIFTWITPIFHLLLSLSSLIFKVPKNRFDSKIIIWKELQLHNIIFTSRSSSVFLYWLYFDVFDKNHSLYIYHVIIRLFIILIHHVTADIVSNNNNKTTTRNINYDNISENVKNYVKKYYALHQFFAINALLLGECDETGKGFLESAFLIMFPIQLSTFLMTLVRKSIISNKTWHIIYGISLLIPYLITINKEQKDYIKPLLSIIFIISRLYFHVNKYTLMILTVYLFIIIM